MIYINHVEIYINHAEIYINLDVILSFIPLSPVLFSVHPTLYLRPLTIIGVSLGWVTGVVLSLHFLLAVLDVDTLSK